MNQKLIKWGSVLIILLVSLNLVLWALGKIKTIFFWIIIAFSAYFAFKILPKIKA